MKPYQIGAVTWSLQIPDLGENLKVIKNELGLRLVQVGFMGANDLADPDKIISSVKGSGLKVSATCVGFGELGEDYTTIETIARSGGYMPDETWKQRYAKTVAVANINQELGVEFLATHVGFVPHDHSHPQYAVMVDRLKRICDALGERGLTLLMETGQEQANALSAFIVAVGLPNIRVNFDPANMVLYGVGEPVEAVDILKDKIVHVHMKDGKWADKPGIDWGQDVVLGTGDANIPGVVDKLREIGYAGPLVIEREAGNERFADIQKAISLLESLGAIR
ncbi:MAG: sugar phosphate isomerase/epimerase [Phycisphaerales bacterium]|nr:sugar phosphate isomerase/epimerase [Phycisphaerales bacterium]